MSSNILIHPITEKHAWKEPVPEGFVSREEFINRTGIFVTPQHFDYIYSELFKKSLMTVDSFIDNFEESVIGEVMEVSMNGTFKYLILDDAVSCLGDYPEGYEPNIWEIINCLARNHASIKEAKDNTILGYKDVANRAIGILSVLQEPATELSS